jgi:hypothetical protein
MSGKDKPLPKPLDTPFGRKKRFENSESTPPLMADKMAMAMAKGSLDEFIKEELPDNEHARKLAEMMMGMTGMTGMMSSGKPVSDKEKSDNDPAPVKEKKSSFDQPPEDVVNAVKSGDVTELTDLLKREHYKRSPNSATDDVNDKKGKPASSQASIEKVTIEQLIKIAADNDLSIDWIFFRALKKYVEDYQKTGDL